MAAPEFRERLWLGPVGWISIIGFASSLGVAYSAATSALWGWGVAAVSAFAAGGLALRSAPLVRVEDGQLWAGKARIPVSALGGVRDISPAEFVRMRRNPAGSSAWWCAPGWVRTAVVVAVDDLRDPHAFWVVATRRPAQLSQALAAAGVPPLRYESSTHR